MNKKKIPLTENPDEKPLFPEIYMDTKKDQEETQELNLKYSNRMLF